jgi:hypothetical protein
MKTIKWETVNEIEHSEAVFMFGSCDFETVYSWREGEYRGETDYYISRCIQCDLDEGFNCEEVGYVLTIHESFNDRYLYFKIKNVI